MRMAAIFGVLITVLVAGFFWANRPITIVIDAPMPGDFPDNGFSHLAFERLLQRFVNADGDVDYASWHASKKSVEQLESYLAAVATTLCLGWRPVLA